VCSSDLRGARPAAVLCGSELNGEQAGALGLAVCMAGDVGFYSKPALMLERVETLACVFCAAFTPAADGSLVIATYAAHRSQATLLDLLRALRRLPQLKHGSLLLPVDTDARTAPQHSQYLQATLLDLLRAFEATAPLSLVACCGARDSLDALVAAAVGVPHCRVWVLVSRLSTLAQFEAADHAKMPHTCS